MPYISDDDRQAIVDTAQRLQIEPRTLAAIISYESNFNPRSVSPSGKGYPVRGLIGFDPSNVRRYGMPAPTTAGQMPQVARYLLDRGWKPGTYEADDLGRLYSIVNAGSLDKNDTPRWGARDINGSISDHVRRIQARHYGIADRMLGGPIANSSMDAIDSALGLNDLPQTPEHWQVKSSRNDMFDQAGITFGSRPQEGAAGKPEKDMFDAAGIIFGPGRPSPPPMENAPPGAAGSVQMPGIGGQRFVDAQGKLIQPENINPQPAPLSQRAKEAAVDVANRLGTAVAESYKGSAAMEKQGFQDIRDALYARGIGKVALGGAGMVLSPLTGAYDLGAQAIDKLTGVPGTGEKVELLPIGPPAARAALKATVPRIAAVDQLVKDVGKENLPGFINRLESNPTLAPMDVAPGVQTRAMGIATGEPSPGQSLLFQKAEERNTAAARHQGTKEAYGATIGAPPDTVQLLDQMKADATRIGQQQIEPALRNAGPVDVTSIVKDIDSQLTPYVVKRLSAGEPVQQLDPISRRLVKLRQQLTYPNSMTGNPFPIKNQYLMDASANPTIGVPGAPAPGSKLSGAHGLQSQLRAEAQDLLDSATGSDRLLGRTIMNVRNKLVDAIDQATSAADAAGASQIGNLNRPIHPSVIAAMGGPAAPAGPGAYKAALSSYRDEMNVQEAFNRGQKITSGTKVGEAGLENRPEFWQRWISGLKPRELEAAQLGARTVIDNHIGLTRQSGRAGLDIPDAPFTRQKLEMLFGKQESDRLISLLADERAKAETNSLLTRNSKTARSQAAQRETRPREVEALTAYTQKILPAAVLEAIQAPLTGTPGLATAGVLGYGALRKGGQMALRSRDIARNTAYARLAADATPEGRQALLSELRSRIQPVGAPNKLTNALRAAGQSLLSP